VTKEIRTFNFRFDELGISKANLKSLLHCSGELETNVLLDLIDDVFDQAAGFCAVEGGYRIIPRLVFEPKGQAIHIGGRVFMVGATVYRQLQGSASAALFVCTAGAGISAWSKCHMASGDLLKGYVIDVMGSLVVETAMDTLESILGNIVKDNGLRITNRYSPGYCGWNVAEQNKLFSLLPERFCGVTLNDSVLMHPIKSVSGIVGIGKTVKNNGYSCALCDNAHCLYRNLKRHTMPAGQYCPERQQGDNLIESPR